MEAFVSHKVGCTECSEPKVDGVCIHDPSYWIRWQPEKYDKFMKSLPEHLKNKIHNQVMRREAQHINLNHMMHPDSFKTPDDSGGFKTS